jgi:hypothetical protein
VNGSHFFEVVQINTTDISSQMRRSAKLNANVKLWVLATMVVCEVCFMFIRGFQIAMSVRDSML